MIRTVRGKRYLLVIIDRFSRWVEAVPSTDQGAQKGGVCVMFGSDCCTYIPNNTAPDGSFNKAMGKLKNLREEVTKNAGADMHTWDWFNSLFGSWGQWLTKVGIIIGIVVVMFLLFCCIVPFIRSMLASAAAKQMINVSVRPTGIDVGCTNTYTVGPELDEFV